MNKRMASAIKRKNTVKKYLFLTAILIYPLALFVVFYVVVNFNSLIMSFKRLDNYEFVWHGWQNYQTVIQDWFGNKNPMIMQAFVNSLLRFIIITGIGLPINMFFAYYVLKNRRGNYVFRIVLMLPTIVSAMLMGLIFQKFVYGLPGMLKTMGVINFPRFLSDSKLVFGTTTFYSIWTGFGTSLILYANAFKGIDSEIIESAKIDGVNTLQELKNIIIPLIMPTLTTLIVTAAAGILGDMGPLFIFFGLEAPAETSNMGYLIYQRTMRGQENYAYVAALGIICTLIAFPLTMIIKRVMEKLDPTFD